VFLNNPKAQDVFQHIQQVKTTVIDGVKALNYNMHQPAKKPYNYNEFWELYNTEGLNGTIKRYFFYSKKRRIRVYVKRIMVNIPILRRYLFKK
jgi:hypothetical protein